MKRMTSKTARVVVIGSTSLSLLAGGCSKEMGALLGAGGGAAAGAIIGNQAGGQKGAIIGGIIGALAGGAAGYYIGKHFEKRKAEEQERRQAEEYAAERRRELPPDTVAQMKQQNVKQAVKVKDGPTEDTYVFVDPTTGKADENAYVLPDEEQQKIAQAQTQGQLTELDGHKIVIQ